MSNMGNVRFRNTLDDLRDCYEHLWDEDLSSEEHEARRQLVRLCAEIADDTETER